MRLQKQAQQVEQKETLAIQYTIEMRNMLKDMPVRDEIRDFLFKVWAEVLAVAAVRKGPQHADTLALKASASDLVWAASAKPHRNDRARVIQDLPNLLQRLRQFHPHCGPRRIRAPVRRRPGASAWHWRGCWQVRRRMAFRSIMAHAYPLLCGQHVRTGHPPRTRICGRQLSDRAHRHGRQTAAVARVLAHQSQGPGAGAGD